MQMFGGALVEFTTVMKSFSTLMQMLLGVVDMYSDMLIGAPNTWIGAQRRRPADSSHDLPMSPDVSRRLPPAGLVFFLAYIILMFLILINVFLAILNDAYAGVKGEMEERIEARKLEQEERLAQGLDDDKPDRFAKWKARYERAQALAIAARGRYHRFKNRVQTYRSNKKKKAPGGVSDF